VRCRAPDPSFAAVLELLPEGGSALRHLLAVGLGTMAFSMQDVLLEPYGGQVLGLSVAATTKLTATLAWAGCWVSGWRRAC
jgi:BCD family chlorophyll transporter-like MFS transporter